MRGAFSRFTFDPRKRYSAVLMQQGRVQLDADWNEQRQIDGHRDTTEATDVIGRAGAPETGGGFQVSELPATRNDFALGEGRLYAGGLLCELHPVPVPVTSIDAAGGTLTLPTLQLDGRAIAAGDWLRLSAGDGVEPALSAVASADAARGVVQLATPAAAFGGRKDALVRRVATYATQPDLVDPPEHQRVEGLIYLDVWQRHVTVIDDPAIREVALGGPDTTTRLQTVFQVRVAPDAVSCDAIAGLRQGESLARMSTLTVAPPPEEDLCLIAPGGGYQGLENRLYRVEVHEGGDLDEATFKWSRDAGAVEYAVEEFPAADPDRVRLTTLGPDELLGLSRFDFVEVTDDGDELAPDPRPGTVVQILDIDRAERLLTLSEALPADRYSVGRRARMRRWDRGDAAAAVREITDDEIELEDGIRVRFSGSGFQTGDAWTFAARALTGDIERLVAAPPQRPRHHLCPLATVSWTGPQTGPKAIIRDCRPPFVGLAELLAQRTLRYAGGDGQDGRAGAELDAPLTVCVEDGLGRPAALADVRFDAQGGGSVSETVVSTDDLGIASVTWKLGPDPDVAQRVVATLADPPQGGAAAVTFAATPHHLALRYAGGDAQEADPRTVLADPLRVAVEDARGRPVAGAVVEFTVEAGGGGLSKNAGGPFNASAPVETGADGVAAVRWRLGRVPHQVVQASLRRGDQDLAAPLFLHAQARRLEVLALAGDGQEGEPGADLACPLVVAVQNGRGNPGTAEVTLEALGGGTLTERSTPANTGNRITVKVDGSAEINWTLGEEPGCRRVIAQLVGADEDVFGAVWQARAAEGGEGQGPYAGPRVKDVSWRNDARLDLATLSGGLTVGFSKPVQKDTLSTSTVELVFELPDMDPTGVYPTHTPHLVALRVAPVDDTRTACAFRPLHQVTVDHLQRWLALERDRFHNNRIRVWVRLYGAAILDDDGRSLDGEASFVREGAVTNLKLPSGDGRAGGDFRSWMWLEG